MVRLHEERDRHHSFPGGSGPVPQHEPQTTATDRLTLYGRGLMPLSPNSYFSPAARMPNFRGASGRCAATSFSCVLRGSAHPRRMLDVLAVRAPGLPVPPGRLMGDGRVLLGGIGQRQPRQPERSSRQQTRFAPRKASANGSVNAKPMGPRLSQLRQRATATHSDTSKANASSLLHRHGLTVTTRGLAEAEPRRQRRRR